jgi:hypothetical protein
LPSFSGAFLFFVAMFRFVFGLFLRVFLRFFGVLFVFFALLLFLFVLPFDFLLRTFVRMLGFFMFVFCFFVRTLSGFRAVLFSGFSVAFCFFFGALLLFFRVSLLFFLPVFPFAGFVLFALMPFLFLLFSCFPIALLLFRFGPWTGLFDIALAVQVRTKLVADFVASGIANFDQNVVGGAPFRANEFAFQRRDRLKMPVRTNPSKAPINCFAFGLSCMAVDRDTSIRFGVS